MVTLFSALLLFAGFYTALVAQVRASTSLYRLCCHFITLNREWHVDAYDVALDQIWIQVGIRGILLPTRITNDALATYVALMRRSSGRALPNSGVQRRALLRREKRV